MTVRMMIRAMLLLAATAMILVALTACGGGSAAQKEEAKPRILPEDEKALRPGEYRSEEFEPSFSLTVGKGWHSVPLETSDKLAIQRGGVFEEGPALGFRNLQEVYEYDKSGTTAEVVKAPKDMVGWFQHHPYLDTDKPEPATVGGVEGVQFDWMVSEDAPTEEITLYKFTDGTTGYAGKGYKIRTIILEGVKGKTVIISIIGNPTTGNPTTEFEDFLPKAQKVVDTVKWEGS
jgi:hypothetical protein